MTSEGIAHSILLNQRGMGSPTNSKAGLRTPISGLKSHRQMYAVATEGVSEGIVPVV